MKYNKSFTKYLNDLGAKSSLPGGGSAAGLAVCLGISLIEMAISFSASEENKDLNRACRKLKKIKTEAFSHIDRDGEMFKRALEAKGSKKKKAYRDLDKITFDLGCGCIKVLAVAKEIRVSIRKSIISDFYIGLAFIRTALFSSLKNLEANSSMFGINNDKKVTYFKAYLGEFAKWLIY